MSSCASINIIIKTSNEVAKPDSLQSERDPNRSIGASYGTGIRHISKNLILSRKDALVYLFTHRIKQVLPHAGLKPLPVCKFNVHKNKSPQLHDHAPITSCSVVELLHLLF